MKGPVRTEGLCNGAPSPPSEREFQLFRDLLARQTGIALAPSKRLLLVSRLQRRLRELGLGSFSDYYKLVAADRSGEELRRMVNSMTTNKTSFFREPHHFEFLENWLRTLEAQSGPRRLRIWCAACATGEEAYSIAMTVLTALNAAAGWNVRILATDIDTDVLDKAQAGRYREETAAGIPAEALRRFFLRGRGEWSGYLQARPELRALITFRQLNLIDEIWPMQRPFDAIFCRNVIIYFDHETKRKVVNHLAGHLRDGGVLFLGHSETTVWSRDLLQPAGLTVFRKQVRE
jgi:chemotaxis protein methyltransferase CheR